MLPWGHLGVGYLALTLVTRRRRGEVPTDGAVWTVLVAAQLPDLVDKPLAWTVDVLPGGRTLGHSAAFAAVVLLVACWLTRSGRSRVGESLAVGHLSHLLADIPPSTLGGELSGVAYLGWPLTTVPSYPDPPGIVPFLLEASSEPGAIVQLGLLSLAGFVWVADGAPGWPHAWRMPR